MPRLGRSIRRIDEVRCWASSSTAAVEVSRLSLLDDSKEDDDLNNDWSVGSAVTGDSFCLGGLDHSGAEFFHRQNNNNKDDSWEADPYLSGDRRDHRRRQKQQEQEHLHYHQRALPLDDDINENLPVTFPPPPVPFDRAPWKPFKSHSGGSSMGTRTTADRTPSTSAMSEYSTSPRSTNRGAGSSSKANSSNNSSDVFDDWWGLPSDLDLEVIAPRPSDSVSTPPANTTGDSFDSVETDTSDPNMVPKHKSKWWRERNYWYHQVKLLKQVDASGDGVRIDLRSSNNRRRSRSSAPQHPAALAQAYMNLGNAHRMAGEYRSSAEAFERAAELWAHLGRPLATVTACEQRARSLCDCDAMDAPERAAIIAHQALLRRMELQGPHHSDTVSSLHRLGICHQRAHQWEDAHDCFAQVVLLRQVIYGKDHPSVAVALTDLGTVHAHSGELRKAMQALLQARRVWDKAGVPASHPNVRALAKSQLQVERLLVSAVTGVKRERIPL